MQWHAKPGRHYVSSSTNPQVSNTNTTRVICTSKWAYYILYPACSGTHTHLTTGVFYSLRETHPYNAQLKCYHALRQYLAIFWDWYIWEHQPCLLLYQPVSAVRFTDTINAMRATFRAIFHASGGSLADRARKAKARFPDVTEVAEITDFVLADAKQELCQARRRGGDAA